MKKIILILRIAVLLFLAFSGKARETLIVRGYLGRTGPVIPVTFRKSMFCYLKGNYFGTMENEEKNSLKHGTPTFRQTSGKLARVGKGTRDKIATVGYWGQEKQ